MIATTKFLPPFKRVLKPASNLKTRLILFFLQSIILFCHSSCKKLVDIPPPVTSITTEQTFDNVSNATSAVRAIYSNFVNSTSSLSFGSGAITGYCGLSSDELNYFFFNPISQFQTNQLQSNNGFVNGSIWQPAYFAIYQANICLEGISNSKGIPSAEKNELTGECKFARALCYFYLTNLFGNVPMPITSNYRQTALLPNEPQNNIYNQIISDLSDAKNLLPADYNAGSGQRVVPNRWAAIALLARTYLYTKNWSKAAEEATSIINNTALFSLTPDLNKTFLVNSSESILQFQHNNNVYPFTATVEGSNFIPQTGASPIFYVTNSLLNSFETGDERKTKWLDTITYAGTIYYYPFKYKLIQGIAGDATYVENYMVLRLAEQYLIRAEANAQEGGDLQQAIADLNTIRHRAGLANSIAVSREDVLQAVYHERRIELFAEWGHRWLDLIRTNQAIDVLKTTKNNISSKALLYPIPFSELQADPNLLQNSGY